MKAIILGHTFILWLHAFLNYFYWIFAVKDKVISSLIFSSILLFDIHTNNIVIFYISIQFSSVAQSCPTLCDPMNHSTPGVPVHYQLLESTQTHVHWVGDAIQPSYPLPSPSPALNLSQHQGLFLSTVSAIFCHHPSGFVSLSVCLCPFLSWSLTFPVTESLSPLPPPISLAFSLLSGLFSLSLFLLFLRTHRSLSLWVSEHLVWTDPSSFL